MIKEYIEAVQSGDSVALSNCFAPRCRYFDYCPITINQPNYHVYGRQGIEMFFLNKFTFRTMVITDCVFEDDMSANFLMAYNGTYLYARATIEQLSSDGLIEELTVRPA